MDQITIEELSQHTDSVIKRVELGETVEVTKNGKPVARVVPIGEPAL